MPEVIEKLKQMDMPGAVIIDPWEHDPSKENVGHRDGSLYIVKIDDKTAGKIVDVVSDRMGHVEKTRHEIKVMELLAHESTMSITRRIDEGGLFGYLMPYYAVTIRDWWLANKMKSVRRRMIEQLESYVAFMASRGWAHGDLTETNIYVDANVPIVGDFQAAFMCADPAFDINGRLPVEHCCGTCPNVNLNDLQGRLNVA